LQKKKMKTIVKPTKRKMSVSIQKRTKDRASGTDYFTHDEIVTMLSVLTKRENDMLANLATQKDGQKALREAKQERLMFVLALELGTRVNELVGPTGLSWDSFDYERKLVEIWDEKKDNHRYCTIPAETWKQLADYKLYLQTHFDMRKEALLFPISSKTANRRIKQWAKEINITRTVRWHMFRHTFVVQSRHVGRDWNYLSIQTGDRASTLIEIYGKLSIEERQSIADQKPLLSKEESS